MNQPQKIVAYYRVSTDKQGATGIGLESQRRTVRQAFPNSEIIGEFEEVLSGNNDSRPQVRRAAELAKETGSTLVFADIDRAGRSKNFLFNILPKLGVPYLDASTPNEDPNSIMMDIKKIFANYEGGKVKTRAIKTVETRRKRGDILGNVGNFTTTALESSAETRRKYALENDNNKQAFAVINLMKGKSLTDISNYLNTYGFKTRGNSNFTPTQVKRVMGLYL